MHFEHERVQSSQAQPFGQVLRADIAVILPVAHRVAVNGRMRRARVGRARDQCKPAGVEHPSDLAHHLTRVRGVLEDLGADDQVGRQWRLVVAAVADGVDAGAWCRVDTHVPLGLQAIDGPYAALDDDAALRASAERALALGYDGKWAIHPSQLETLRDVFTPTADEVERARRILATNGAVRLDGDMVDEATKKLAEGVLARAGGNQRVE